MNNILNDEQIELMKVSGRILRDSLFAVRDQVRSGISTKELDTIAEKEIVKRGATPSFKNYFVRGVGRYPAALCISINDEIVHGLPDSKRKIAEGDLVSLDLGASYRGICSDMAITVCVGTPTPEIEKFLRVTEQSLYAGISAAHSGARIGAIGNKVQTIAESEGYGVVRDLVGHGIGAKPHLDPMIPNYGDRDEGPVIVEHMALAIEPMLTLGDYEIDCDDNGWTIRTRDRSLSSHFEHTVVIIDDKPVIVTK